MKRFRFDSAVILYVGIVVLIGILGTFGRDVLYVASVVVHTAGFYEILAVGAACILAAFVSGLNLRFPSYLSRATISDLREHLKPSMGTAVMGLLLAFGIVGLIMMVPELTRIGSLALNGSLGLTVGVIGRCLWISGSIVHQYQAQCSAYDSIPLHQRNC